MAAPAAATPERLVASGSAEDLGRGRTALHLLVAVVGWLGFITLWVWQLEVFVPANWLSGLELIGVFLVVFALASPAWVLWNRSIYRRRHRRATPIVLEVQFERDSLDRPLAVSPAVLLHPAEIRVTVSDDGAVKRYDVPERAAPARAEQDRAVGVWTA